MTGCVSDADVNATDHTISYSWTPPSFTDPLGSDLDIVSNYLTPGYTFPWGDHTVQYVATKIRNGMSTECSFTIKVRRKFDFISYFKNISPVTGADGIFLSRGDCLRSTEKPSPESRKFSSVPVTGDSVCFFLLIIFRNKNRNK